MGGSGWWPGTVSRKARGFATSGALPTVRWMGGRVRQAPVAGALDAGPDGVWVSAGAAPPAAPSPEPEELPPDDALRPKGQGRRTGL